MAKRRLPAPAVLRAADFLVMDGVSYELAQQKADPAAIQQTEILHA